MTFTKVKEGSFLGMGMDIEEKGNGDDNFTSMRSSELTLTNI